MEIAHVSRKAVLGSCPGWADKQKTALLFGITNDHVFALANVLLSLKRHNVRFWKNIVVYHEGLDPADQAALLEIEPCEFRLYEPTFKKESTFNKWSMNMYSMLMFARYEAFKMLDEYDVVLWLDVDILIRGDISILVKQNNISGIGLVLANRNEFVLKHTLFSPVSNYDMTAPVFNSGLMVVNHGIKEKATEIYDWLNQKTIEYAQHLRWPDMAMLNLMIHEFKIIPTCIDLDKYQKHPYWDSNGETAIVHAHGPQKFWNWPAYWCKYPEWRKNHRKWIILRKKQQNPNDQPLVSVIIPTLNAEKYLRRTLISMVEQTLFKQEIIIVDGGSEDGTLKIVKSFNDHRIRVIDDQSNTGIAGSLNKGIREARGKYIARMDADDISLPYRLAAQYKFLETHSEIAVCGTSVQTFQDESWTFQSSDRNELLECQLLTSTPFIHPSMMWRAKDFLSNDYFYDESFCANEDFELWQRVSEKLKFSSIQQPLLCYRMHGNNAQFGGKTKEVQFFLINRAFMQFGVEFSHNALMLLDQRNNSNLLSDGAITRAMREIYKGFLYSCKANSRYDKKALAWHLLCHLRWIYFERAQARGASKREFMHTAWRLGWMAKSWVAYSPDENFSSCLSRIKRYWSMFKASPMAFTKKVIKRFI